VALYPSEYAVMAAARLEVSGVPARARSEAKQRFSEKAAGTPGRLLVKEAGAVVRALVPVPALVLEAWAVPP